MPATPFVLITEENRDIKLFLARMVILIRPAVTVGLAASAAEAFLLMDQRAPDLLITNDQMPAKGDLSLVRLLRLRQFTFPILVMSANANQMTESPTTGPIGFLRRPFTTTALRQSLNGLLRS
jgi:DNA-binding response OmpR family regulator